MVNDLNNLHYEEKLKELSLFPSGEKKAQEICHQCIPVLQGQLQRG